MLPTVTIIMATLNRAHLIKETIISIQNQNYKNWECLIIDDGTSDNTIEVIAPILQQDLRFQFLKRPDSYKKGLPGCRNFGLDLAKGEHLVFFDDDDIIHPDNLKICLDYINNTNIDFCHYQKSSFITKIPLFKEIQKSKNEVISLNKNNIEDVVTEKIGLASCTVIWKRKCFSTIRFNEKLLYAEEWECYVRIISEGFRGIIIDSVLYYNRKHLNSNTGQFYNHNPIQKESKKDAIILILENLKEKKILTNSIIKYLVTSSRSFKEYQLFNRIMEILDLNTFERLKWIFYYKSYPIRLKVYKIKKNKK